MRIDGTFHVGIVIKKLALLTGILSKLAIGFNLLAAEFPSISNNANHARPYRDKADRYEQKGRILSNLWL